MPGVCKYAALDKLKSKCNAIVSMNSAENRYNGDNVSLIQYFLPKKICRKRGGQQATFQKGARFHRAWPKKYDFFIPVLKKKTKNNVKNPLILYYGLYTKISAWIFSGAAALIKGCTVVNRGNRKRGWLPWQRLL